MAGSNIQRKDMSLADMVHDLLRDLEHSGGMSFYPGQYLQLYCRVLDALDTSILHSLDGTLETAISEINYNAMTGENQGD